ncbi:MAG TPA: glycosyltransferase family 39 protein [Ktedonobacterales bacterium]|nr:glycosyltransferase family 39 protein [Ktedonobacterales bacterium]
MSLVAPAESRTRMRAFGGAIWRGGMPERRFVALLALVAAALYLWPIAGFSRNYDEGVYWQSLRAMASGHPLFTSVFSSQPPLFLLSVYPFYMAFGQTIAAARVGIALFAVMGVVAMYWLASQVGGRWAGLIAAALLAVDLHYLHQAQTLQAEGPAVAVAILAVALAVAASRRAGRWRMALAALAGAALALGILIKLLDAVALVPIALYLSAPFLRAFDGGVGRVRRPTATKLRAGAQAAGRDLGLVVVGGAMGTILVLAPFAGSLSLVWDQAVAFHLAAIHTQPWPAEDNLRMVLTGFTLMGIPAALAVVIAWRRRDWRMAPPLLWLLATGAVLVRQVPLFDHHIAFIAPCLALMIGLTPAMLGPEIHQVTGRWLVLAAAALTAAVFITGLAYGLLATRAAARPPNSATQAQIDAIRSATTPGEVVVSDDQYIAAAAGRSAPPQLVDTSFVRASSGYLTARQIEAILTRDNVRVIVMDSGRLAKVPGFGAWLHAHYRMVADVGDGAALYIRLEAGR